MHTSYLQLYTSLRWIVKSNYSWFSVITCNWIDMFVIMKVDINITFFKGLGTYDTMGSPSWKPKMLLFCLWESIVEDFFHLLFISLTFVLFVFFPWSRKKMKKKTAKKMKKNRKGCVYDIISKLPILNTFT